MTDVSAETTIPAVPYSLLVRVAPSDERWDELVHVVETETEHGFVANVLPVEAPGMSVDELIDAVRRSGPWSRCVFVADERTLSAPDLPVLVVDGMRREASFRCAADSLFAVDANLNSGNLAWQYFHEKLGPDGVHRDRYWA
ncbi:DUF6924 domain-containing protein [Nocardioides zeae]|uniref:DUF6924 domain-containing protein n=1 Tax=Nocardioides zeae TaxID=1457234 RepID=A0A6P0HFP7_9ACTN|nr:hypothetical protein [Nocardioides zeae]NEN77411.1 hypothetical protein [Nocardioides zeae]